MNSTGLSIIKTLGCTTVVTLFIIYNTRDHYDYDYHWTLGLSTFISTIATPLFFVVVGHLDVQTRHDANWQIGRIKSVAIVFLFWITVYYVWEPYQCGYLIQPWFIFALIVIYTFHPFIAWLSRRRNLFFTVVLTLLCCAHGYDLLSVLYPDKHLFSPPPQYRLWTWLLFYLTGQLFNDPRVAEWMRDPRMIKAPIIVLPLVHLFTWFYERHFFPVLFKADRNALTLAGSQIYVLIALLVIAANVVQFKKNRELREVMLVTVSKVMTGVCILYCSVLHLLVMLIPIHSLATRLGVITLTFILSVLISLAVLPSTLLKKVIILWQTMRQPSGNSTGC